jgi:methionyl-tRNA synthetase
MLLAQEVNRYLEEESPWKRIRTEREACATILYTSLTSLNYLKTMLYPYLPFSSQQLHQLLGFEGKISNWQPEPLLPGQKLAPPKPLFRKLSTDA